MDGYGRAEGGRTGVAMAALIMEQSAANCREIAGLRKALRHELSGIRERLARLAGVIDMVRVGMQSHNIQFRPRSLRPAHDLPLALTAKLMSPDAADASDRCSLPAGPRWKCLRSVSANACHGG